jgi:hypothetical protein
MSDPRSANSFSLGPYPHEVATFAHDDTIVYDAALVGGAAQVGLAVSIESDNVVTLAGSGENVLGKLLSVASDGFCSVQHEGFMTLPGGTSATLTAGLKIVGDLLASAEGYIQAVSTEDTVSRGMIIDASVTTAVVVKL